MGKYCLLVSLVLSWMLNFSISQSIIYYFGNSPNESFNISNIRKLTFELNTLVIQFQDGTVLEKEIESIDRIEYSASMVNLESIFTDFTNYLFEVSPNPFEETIIVKVGSPHNENFNIDFFNLQGLLVKSVKPYVINNEKLQIDIDLSDLDSGEYLCRLSYEKVSITKKIVKK